MTEIKRYEFDILDCNGGSMRQSPRGGYVIYKDHGTIVAALQDQVRTLAAEDAAFIDDYRNTTALRRMWLPETPDTDAALREIRAQAMDEAAEEVDEWIGNDLLAQELRKKAARIREGEQP